jgi:hypothetical protein
MSTSSDFSGGTSYDVSRASRDLFLFAEWANFFAVRGALATLTLVVTADPRISQFVVNALGLLVAPIVGLSKYIHWTNQRRAHARRGRQAKLIFDDLDRGGTPRYCLYLRPFLTSERLRVANSRFRRRFLPSLDRFFGHRIDLETVFAIALERAGHPLIAIGETGFLSGAPKLLATDRNWQEIFTKLARNATSIIIVPLPRPSTVWELNKLLDEPALLKKTMFVMPMRLRSGVQEQLEPFWAEIHDMMECRGLDFPRLDPAGRLFFLDDGGRVLHQIDSGGFDIDYIDAVLRGLVNRAFFDVIYDALPVDDRRALLDVLDMFLYFSPRHARLQARPVRLHELFSLVPAAHLVSSLIGAGLVLTYRLQGGSQLWRESQLHPAVLDSKVLRAWFDQNEARLRAKGIVIESCLSAHRRQAQALGNFSAASLALPNERSQLDLPATTVSEMLPDSVDGYLGPDERRHLRTRRQEH